MAGQGTTTEVRMYNVGFGDAFRITVRDGTDVWRMLIDCGMHPHSAGARPIADVVATISQTTPLMADQTLIWS